MMIFLRIKSFFTRTVQKPHLKSSVQYGFTSAAQAQEKRGRTGYIYSSHW